MKNLTPHTVVVRDTAGVDHTYPPSGTVARVGMRSTPSAALEDGTPTSRVEYGRAELPPIELPEGVRRVVSYMHFGGGRRLTRPIYVRAPSSASVSAQSSSHRSTLTIDGVEYVGAACDAFLVEVDRRYIVSTMFADAYRAQHEGDEDDAVLFVPDSGPSAIRENGQIVAVRSLIRR